jgi:hypothetical protein
MIHGTFSLKLEDHLHVLSYFETDYRTKNQNFD